MTGSQVAAEILTELEGFVDAQHERGCGPSPMSRCTYYECVAYRAMVRRLRRKVYRLRAAEREASR